jgi:uncharacterized protein YlxW (UPF0749 family)
MIDCCELALRNGQLALRIAYGAFGTIAFLILVAFGYSLKWRKQQLELSQRTDQLEKKNGKEEALILSQQKQINQLQAEIEKIKKTK